MNIPGFLLTGDPELAQPRAGAAFELTEMTHHWSLDRKRVAFAAKHNAAVDQANKLIGINPIQLLLLA